MTPSELRRKRQERIKTLVSSVGPVAAIIALHRERTFMMDQRKRCDLALGAYLRRAEGWRKDLPENERQAINAIALGMIDGVPADHPHYDVISSAKAGRKAFVDQEDEATYCMEKIAETLPVWKAYSSRASSSMA